MKNISRKKRIIISNKTRKIKENKKLFSNNTTVEITHNIKPFHICCSPQSKKCKDYINKTFQTKFKLGELKTRTNNILDLHDLYLIDKAGWEIDNDEWEHNIMEILPPYIQPIDLTNHKLFNKWFQVYYLYSKIEPKNKNDFYVLVNHRGTNSKILKSVEHNDELSINIDGIKSILLNLRNVIPIKGHTYRSLYAKDGQDELNRLFGKLFLKRKQINFGGSQGAIYANQQGHGSLITIVFNPVPYIISAWGKKPDNLIQIKVKDDLVASNMDTEEHGIYRENIIIDFRIIKQKSYTPHKIEKYLQKHIIHKHMTLSLNSFYYPVLTKEKINDILERNCLL